MLTSLGDMDDKCHDTCEAHQWFIFWCAVVSRGQGLQRDFNLPASPSQLRVITCPADLTIGAKTLTFGINAIIPCKPIVTLCGSGFRYNNVTDTCYNPAGFGAYSSGAAPCIPGSWAAEASNEPCTDCAAGRETLYHPIYQSSESHCYVTKGYGVYNATGGSEEAIWFDQGFQMPKLINEQAMLEVHECPIGRYSTSVGDDSGGQFRVSNVGARCERCPQYSTTATSGATRIEDCFGKQCMHLLVPSDLQHPQLMS